MTAKQYIPSRGDFYYTCGDDGTIHCYTWWDGFHDKKKLATGLVWKTEEEAVDYLVSKRTTAGPAAGTCEQVPWIPAYNEHYWTVVVRAYVALWVWKDGASDRERLASGLVFRTHADASVALAAMTQERIAAAIVPKTPEAEMCDDDSSHKVTASAVLLAADRHMQDRAKVYDKPDGERSMAATVEAFNAIRGANMTEAEGWLFLSLLKLVRLFQRPGYHADSAEDAAAYIALMAEAKAKEAGNE